MMDFCHFPTLYFYVYYRKYGGTFLQCVLYFITFRSLLKGAERKAPWWPVTNYFSP